MGMGHGVYFVSVIVSAPFAVLGVFEALGATVAMATALAALAGTRAGAMLLAAHYAGLVAVFRMVPGFADFERFGAMPAWLRIIATGTLMGYAAAQAWLIRQALRAK